MKNYMHVITQSWLLFIWRLALNLASADESDDIRLVGGTSQCTGTLEIKYQGEWRPVCADHFWNWKRSDIVCRQLDCGSAVSTVRRNGTVVSVWQFRSPCVGSVSKLNECGELHHKRSDERLELICSESARLVDWTRQCSGRVEVKSNQSWVSVCEGDFDKQDAEVVCRELGCGPPSLLQGALYGEAKALMLTKEFQCKGNESALLNCGTSGSTRNTCSPDKAVGLICSELDDVRLVGGSNRCNGTLEIKHQGEWRPAQADEYVLDKLSAVVCGELRCGHILGKRNRRTSTFQDVWWIGRPCFESETSLRECGTRLSTSSFDRYELICSEDKGSLWVGENTCDMCRFRAECDHDAYDVWCLCNIDCMSAPFDPVCASDGRSYANPCQVREASCTKQQHMVAKYPERCRGP